MIVGFDFDNTIVSYDQICYDIAIEKKLIPKNIPQTKNDVRNYLRGQEQEEIWIELQGLIYGPHMHRTKPFQGAVEFLQKFQATWYIISHKTQYPYSGTKYDLHKYTREWMKQHNINQNKVHLKLTKEEKLKQIEELKCDYFIDDLPELLKEKNFSQSTQKILFDPNNRHANFTEGERVKSWQEIANFFQGVLV